MRNLTPEETKRLLLPALDHLRRRNRPTNNLHQCILDYIESFPLWQEGAHPESAICLHLDARDTQ